MSDYSLRALALTARALRQRRRASGIVHISTSQAHTLQEEVKLQYSLTKMKLLVRDTKYTKTIRIFHRMS